MIYNNNLISKLPSIKIYLLMAILLFDIHGGFCQISQDSVIIGNPQHKHKVSAIIIGKVLDTKGMPIKWATISINSLKIGTVSDAGGNYVLIIPTGKHEIMVRYIGVDTRIIPVHIYSNGYLNVILKEQEVSIAHFSERNLFRVPDYARLDLSLTIGGKIPWLYPKKDRSNSKYKGSLSISIFNFLGRKNAFSVFFKVPENGFTPQAHRLSVIGAAVPALTYNFSF